MILKDRHLELARLTYRHALDERIARVAWLTAANRIVIDHVTDSSESTGAWARVCTFLVAASLCQGAIGADCALRPASRRRTYEPCHTGADWLLVDFSTDAVGTARRRGAGVPLYGICGRIEGSRYKGT